MGKLFTPLDHVLTSKSKVRVLRVLMPLASPVSAREAARLAGLSHRSTLLALNDLAGMGVVNRQEAPGQFLVTVNRRHFLIRQALEQLFRAEVEWRQALSAEIKRISVALDGRQLEPGIHLVAAFGSSARGEDHPESDLDLLAVARSREIARNFHDLLSDTAPELQEHFGLRLSPMVLDLERLRELPTRQKELWESIRADHWQIYGDRTLEELALG